MNKKILAISIGLLIATTVLAQTVPGTITKCTMTNSFGDDWPGLDCPAAEVECLFNSDTYNCAACCVLDTIYSVTNWIFYGVILLSGVFVAMGAWKIMTAGGNPENVNTGRSYIMWAMIGLAVALMAKSIPEIAKSLLRLG